MAGKIGDSHSLLLGGGLNPVAVPKIPGGAKSCAAKAVRAERSAGAGKAPASGRHRGARGMPDAPASGQRPEITARVQ